MPITDRHPEYDKHRDQYIRCRDVIDGSDAVKNKNEKYLPPLSGQSMDSYRRYKQRGLFFSVASRALSGLTGMASRRHPKLEYSEDMKYYFEDVANTGMSFNEVFLETLNEVMLMSKMFIMIDFPAKGGNPYLVTYKAEDVINWHIQDSVLQWVIIKQSTYVFDEKDPYKRIPKNLYTKLSIETGEYTVSVYDDKEKQYYRTVTPKVKNRSLTFIPGFFITPNGINATTIKPAMLDIVDLNLTFYQLMTDYLNGLHLIAVPTPVFTGATESETIKMGPESAIVMPEPTSKAFFLEFQGVGLGSVENALTMLMSQMALFSSRLTSDTGKGSESAVSVQLRYSSESATLSAVVNACQAALTQIYTWVAQFNGVEVPKIELHKQFLNTKISAQELAQYTNMYLNQTIDQETYYNILYNGEVPVSAALKDGNGIVPKAPTVATDPQPAPAVA